MLSTKKFEIYVGVNYSPKNSNDLFTLIVNPDLKQCCVYFRDKIFSFILQLGENFLKLQKSPKNVDFQKFRKFSATKAWYTEFNPKTEKKISGERKESWLPHQCSDQLSGNHFPSARRKAITVLEVVNLSGGLNHQTVDTTVSQTPNVLFKRDESRSTQASVLSRCSSTIDSFHTQQREVVCETANKLQKLLRPLELQEYVSRVGLLPASQIEIMLRERTLLLK